MLDIDRFGRMNDLITSIVSAAIERARAKGELKSTPASITVEQPRDPTHGDRATNVALALAREEKKAPRVIAEIIRANVELSAELKEVTVAGRGFINFRMAPAYWRRQMRRAGEEGAAFFRPQPWELRAGGGRKFQVEFLSANPTGPLTVGHGRNAVLGDTIARMYESAGFDVTREYYFNDGGRQMKLLGESVRVRYLEELGREATLPQDGYQGEYIREIARSLVNQHGDTLTSATGNDAFRKAAVDSIFADIRATCERLGIRFTVFTNELDLMREGRVDAVVAALRERGLVQERDGAVWLRGEPLGLPKDVVLIRSGPEREPTYRAPDIAYHLQKLERGFDLVVDVFGADHIAEHQGVIAAVKALGGDTSTIRAIIYQFVTLTRGGERVKMSTRRATYVTLDELLDEVGADVVRFFFLFRKHDSHLDFDLDLAKRQAPENPVFYVQYAHARMASVFREGEKAELGLPPDRSAVDLALLTDEELELAKLALGLREVMTESARALEPHRVAFYLLE
ncbi:MAG: arginine--tRNA ligase, partial [Candidatus Binataceae bacterium]